MKNRNYLTLILLVFLIVVSFGVANAQTDKNGGYGGVLKKSGLAQSTINMQNGIADQVKELMSQKDSEQTTAKKTGSKNYAVFKPSQLDNLKIIADELGKNAEEKALYLQLFTETKKGFEAEVASKGMKNNIAAAMTFLMATTVMVYNEAPEPSDEATEKLFNGLNTIIDETPGMANVPNKDKQFLYDAYISFGGLTLAFYSEGKDTKDKDLVKVARVMAGSLLLELFKINPNTIHFEGNSLRMKSESGENSPAQTPRTTSKSHNFTKSTTNFDDGWVGTPQTEFVSLKRNGVEVRLFYANSEWENSIPSTTQYDDFYWEKTVTPYFNVGNLAKWSDAGFFMEKAIQADAVDKQTGKRCFVTLWFVGQGGNRGVTVVVAPNRNDFQREFPNLKNISNLNNANRFAVTAQDIVGTWLSGTGGGGLDYYTPDGKFIVSNTLSQDDEFIFNANGTYQHIYKSANLNMGSNQFAKLQYQGKFSVTDWELTATNHYQGKTARFTGQLVAVRGGYLLVLTDSRNDKKYTLVKKR